MDRFRGDGRMVKTVWSSGRCLHGWEKRRVVDTNGAIEEQDVCLKHVLGDQGMEKEQNVSLKDVRFVGRSLVVLRALNRSR